MDTIDPNRSLAALALLVARRNVGLLVLLFPAPVVLWLVIWQRQWDLPIRDVETVNLQRVHFLLVQGQELLLAVAVVQFISSGGRLRGLEALRGLTLRRIAMFLLAQAFWVVMTLALFMTVGIVLGVVAVQFDATLPEGWMPAGLAMALVIVLFCFGLMGPRILVAGIWSVVTAARTIEAHFWRAFGLVVLGAGPLVGLNEHVNGYVALVVYDHGDLSGNGVMGAEEVMRACLASALSMISTVVLWVALMKLYLTTEPVTRITRHRPVKPEIFD